MSLQSLLVQEDGVSVQFEDKDKKIKLNSSQVCLSGEV